MSAELDKFLNKLARFKLIGDVNSLAYHATPLVFLNSFFAFELEVSAGVWHYDIRQNDTWHGGILRS